MAQEAYQEFVGTVGSQTPPVNGTVIFQNVGTNCAITVSGVINQAYIHDLDFETNQPVDGSFSTPNVYKPFICLLSAGSGTAINIDRVLCYNAYQCIQIGTQGGGAVGRVHISNFKGFCYSICIIGNFSADAGSMSHAEMLGFRCWYKPTRLGSSQRDMS